MNVWKDRIFINWKSWRLPGSKIFVRRSFLEKNSSFPFWSVWNVLIHLFSHSGPFKPGADPGGRTALAPKISSKSCSFQVILREETPILSKFFAQGPPPPWGQSSPRPPLNKIVDLRLQTSPGFCLGVRRRVPSSFHPLLVRSVQKDHKGKPLDENLGNHFCSGGQTAKCPLQGRWVKTGGRKSSLWVLKRKKKKNQTTQLRPRSLNMETLFAQCTRKIATERKFKLIDRWIHVLTLNPFREIALTASLPGLENDGKIAAFCTEKSTSPINLFSMTWI